MIMTSVNIEYVTSNENNLQCSINNKVTIEDMTSSSKRQAIIKYIFITFENPYITNFDVNAVIS